MHNKCIAICQNICYTILETHARCCDTNAKRQKDYENPLPFCVYSSFVFAIFIFPRTQSILMESPSLMLLSSISSASASSTFD